MLESAAIASLQNRRRCSPVSADARRENRRARAGFPARFRALAAAPDLIRRRFAEDRQTLFLGRIADLPDARAVRLKAIFSSGNLRFLAENGRTTSGKFGERGIPTAKLTAYILAQLDLAGLPHHTFTDDALGLILRISEGTLRAVKNLCVGALIEAVRDQTKTVGIKQVNAVLMQPHWRHNTRDEPAQSLVANNQKTKPK